MSEIPPSLNSAQPQTLLIEKIDAHRVGMISLALHVSSGLLFLPFALAFPFFLQLLIQSSPELSNMISPEACQMINASSWLVSLASFFVSLAVAAVLGYALGYSLAWFYEILAKWKPNTFALKITTSPANPHA